MSVEHKNPRILRLPQVLARTGMGKSWVYREMAGGRFPKAFKIGRASGWEASAVDAWIEDQVGGGGSMAESNAQLVVGKTTTN